MLLEYKDHLGGFSPDPLYSLWMIYDHRFQARILTCASTAWHTPADPITFCDYFKKPIHLQKILLKCRVASVWFSQKVEEMRCLETHSVHQQLEYSQGFRAKAPASSCNSPGLATQSNTPMKELSNRDGEMALSVKCLLHKSGDLILNSCEYIQISAWFLLGIPVLGRQRLEDPVSGGC